MAYFLGFLLLVIGIIIGCFGIENIDSTESLTVLNVQMLLCAICGLGFAGILFALGGLRFSNNTQTKSTTIDDEDL